MSNATQPSTPALPLMSLLDLRHAWAYVEACCIALYGEERGREEAKKVPLRVGMALWLRVRDATPEA